MLKNNLCGMKWNDIVVRGGREEEVEKGWAGKISVRDEKESE